MKRLEPVYLANVILYIKSIETVTKLIQVNTKSREATKMIRYYNPRKLYENDDWLYYSFGFKNLFEIFPNIETINCRQQDIENNLELFGKVKLIELCIRYFSKPEQMTLSQGINDKIILLDIFCNSLEFVSLNRFPNVKKVKVSYWEIGFLKEFLGNNHIKLKQFIIQTKDNGELDCLENYKNIENIIVCLKEKIAKERYLQLKSFANVYTQIPIAGIDEKETMGPSYLITLSGSCDINRIYDLSLFTKCQVLNDCDLRNCELLEQIYASILNKNQISIQLKGLSHLLEIENIHKVDCIPSSVTYLSLYSTFNYNELLEKDNDCFGNINEFRLEIVRNEKFEDFEILMNFKNCTKIEIHNGINLIQPFTFPINIKELIIENCDNKNQIKEISKLTELKKLSIQYNSYKDKKIIKKMYKKLINLEWLKTNYIEGIKLPSTVTYLELNVQNKTNLKKYQNLKEMKLYLFGENKSEEIILPNKLNRLIIYGNVVVTNSHQIEVDKIILDNTISQLREWKSKNIFIRRRYGKIN